MHYYESGAWSWSIDDYDLNDIKMKNLLIPGYKCPVDIYVKSPNPGIWEYPDGIPIGLKDIPFPKWRQWGMRFNGLLIDLQPTAIYCCLITRRTVMECLATVHSTRSGNNNN
jgi:hypothetical protein